jgi:predicted NBD/HSP70 family sugar kinase
MEKRVLGVITDLSTRVIGNLDVPLPDHEPQTVVDVTASAVSRLIEQADVNPDRLIGVGLALAGQVDAEHGICRQMQRSGWRDVPIARMLADTIRIPVWADNDANAFAVSQHLFGHGRGHLNLAAIALGRGVGAGLVIGGRVYNGASGSAGEFGHSLAERGGRLCECGRKGCLETYCGDRGLVQTWNERDPATVGQGPQQLAEAADGGDLVARKVLRDGGKRLGRHIAALVNVMDPEIIVFGGEGVRYGRHLFDSLRRELQQQVYGTVPAIAVNWGDDGWQRGAAALAIQHFFDFEIRGGQSSLETNRLPMSA